MRQYQTPLYNYVARVLNGDRALAEDMCQEVFLRVYQALPGFDSRCQFTTWMFQVAKHRVVDELRARERRGAPRSSSSSAPQLHLSVAPAESLENMDVVWEAIGAAQPRPEDGAAPARRGRAVLRGDLRALDTTLATVKWRIYKARETVVAELDPGGFHAGRGRHAQAAQAQ